ncbi:MAG: 30S ribosomal protein S6 [Planctomycetota bacterium]|jgi:small subunit ribosomal protein S6
MSNERINTYEGMFLFPHSATANLKDAADHVKDLLGRASAEIITFKKWDERRLAYEIKGNKRGVYFLSYFKAPAANMIGLERDCNLSEQLLRTMFLRADTIPAETIEAADGRQELEDEIKLRGEEAENRAKAKAESDAAAEAAAAAASDAEASEATEKAEAGAGSDTPPAG